MEQKEIEIQHLQLTIRDLEIKVENAQIREGDYKKDIEELERKIVDRKSKDFKQENLLT